MSTNNIKSYNKIYTLSSSHTNILCNPNPIILVFYLRSFQIQTNTHLKIRFGRRSKQVQKRSPELPTNMRAALKTCVAHCLSGLMKKKNNEDGKSDGIVEMCGVGVSVRLATSLARSTCAICTFAGLSAKWINNERMKQTGGATKGPKPERVQCVCKSTACAEKIIAGFGLIAQARKVDGNTWGYQEAQDICQLYQCRIAYFVREHIRPLNRKPTSVWWIYMISECDNGSLPTTFTFSVTLTWNACGYYFFKLNLKHGPRNQEHKRHPNRDQRNYILAVSPALARLRFVLEFKEQLTVIVVVWLVILRSEPDSLKIIKRNLMAYWVPKGECECLMFALYVEKQQLIVAHSCCFVLWRQAAKIILSWKSDFMLWLKEFLVSCPIQIKFNSYFFFKYDFLLFPFIILISYTNYCWKKNWSIIKICFFYNAT